MSSIFENMTAWLQNPGVQQALGKLDYSIIDREDSLPRSTLRFRAFQYFKPEETQVVIIGQDPYHTPGKANGLAFGVNSDFNGNAWAGSLGNIRSEIRRSTGLKLEDATLESWAKQGVLLLNTRLSVSEGRPLSHAQVGWKEVIDAILMNVLRTGRKPKFMLWGKEAQRYVEPVQDFRCQLFTASPPSPLGAHRGPEPFHGCDHFARISSIDWGRVPNGTESFDDL